MNQVPLFTLPVSSCDTYRDVFPYANCLLYDYQRDDGKKIRTGIRFFMITAFRKRVEESCIKWHYEHYDTLVEVQDSPWIEEFRPNLTGPQSKWVVQHYKLFVHGNCFEYLAASWDILPDHEGIWDDVFPDRKLFAK